jgi:hypothetical protein
MSVASPALRDAIIQAMGRAEQNGYLPDDDDHQEAIDVMMTDSEVERLCGEQFDGDDGEAIAAVTAVVAEWKAGVRE